MARFLDMKAFKEDYIEKYGDYLAKEGKRLIDTAYASKDYNNRTYNLHDSYGSCVFYNGKELPNTRRYVGRKAVTGKKNGNGELVLGRAEIDKYFDTYKSSFKGFEIVTAVAIFYGVILEKGLGRLRRKYKVISGMDSEMQALADKLGGKIVKINI